MSNLLTWPLRLWRRWQAARAAERQRKADAAALFAAYFFEHLKDLQLDTATIQDGSVTTIDMRDHREAVCENLKRGLKL